ncbi:hypothetical protein GCM10010335_69450 [Streptomyces galbus]|nr:hypothetical protein GCM10010335_69450 [Streptomyces galbus]
MSALGEKPRGGRTGGPAADDDDVEIVRKPEQSGRHARPSPVPTRWALASRVKNSFALAERVHGPACRERTGDVIADIAQRELQPFCCASPARPHGIKDDKRRQPIEAKQDTAATQVHL